MEGHLPEMECRDLMAICIYTLGALVFRMVLLRPTLIGGVVLPKLPGTKG